MIDGETQFFPLTLDRILDHAAKWTPNTEVVTAVEGGEVERIGYAALRSRSRRVSALLRRLGVRTGDRVATLAWNTQAHVEVWYAIMGMGAVCHTLNVRLTEDQLAEMARRSQARILFASGDLAPLAERIAALAPDIERIVVLDHQPADLAPGLDRLEDLLAETAPPAPGQALWGGFEETTPSGLCFTSGTTGAPKGVTYTHRSSFLHTLRLLQADVLGLTLGDSLLVAVPMFHANAWGLPFAAPAAGTKMVLPGRRLDGASLAGLINAEGVTIAVGIATVWLGLVEHLEEHGGETPSLQRVVVGGAPLAPALMARIERRLGAIVQTSWGMTELSPSGTFAPPGLASRSAQVSGRPALGVDLLLTDAKGRPLAEQRGVEGYLRVRGAAVVQRYFGETEPAVDADGWFDTGDLARIDADGQLTVTGRAKNLIKSGGEWINPAEIEALVAEHPKVSLAAVIGRPDPKWGERPVLVLQTHGSEDVSDEALIALLQGKVASWWIPDAIIRVPQMPLAPTGKIDTMRLRVEHGGG